MYWKTVNYQPSVLIFVPDPTHRASYYRLLASQLHCFSCSASHFADERELLSLQENERALLNSRVVQKQNNPNRGQGAIGDQTGDWGGLRAKSGIGDSAWKGERGDRSESRRTLS